MVGVIEHHVRVVEDRVTEAPVIQEVDALHAGIPIGLLVGSGAASPEEQHHAAERVNLAPGVLKHLDHAGVHHQIVHSLEHPERRRRRAAMWTAQPDDHEHLPPAQHEVASKDGVAVVDARLESQQDRVHVHVGVVEDRLLAHTNVFVLGEEEEVAVVVYDVLYCLIPEHVFVERQDHPIPHAPERERPHSDGEGRELDDAGGDASLLGWLARERDGDDRDLDVLHQLRERVVEADHVGEVEELEAVEVDEDVVSSSVALQAVLHGEEEPDAIARAEAAGAAPRGAREEEGVGVPAAEDAGEGKTVLVVVGFREEEQRQRWRRRRGLDPRERRAPGVADAARVEAVDLAQVAADQQLQDVVGQEVPWPELMAIHWRRARRGVEVGDSAANGTRREDDDDDDDGGGAAAKRQTKA